MRRQMVTTTYNNESNLQSLADINHSAVRSHLNDGSCRNLAESYKCSCPGDTPKYNASKAYDRLDFRRFLESGLRSTREGTAGRVSGRPCP